MSAKKLDHMGAPRWLWWFAFIAGTVTLVSGSYGMWLHDGKHHGEPVTCVFSSLYFALQMLILHTPHFGEGSNRWIELGRWAGAVTLLVTTGLLLGKRLAHEWRMIRMSLFQWEQHHVVCGLGHKGLEIVRCLKTQDGKRRKPLGSVRVVVIEPEPGEHFASECAAMGVGVITGDASNPQVLIKARVFAAKEIIVITPGDETNIRIASEVRKVCATRKSHSVECYVHLSNIHLRERLQQYAATGGRHHCQLNFFDVFDNEARRVLQSLPLDGNGISESDPRTVHVVILGFGRMGRSLALRAAKMGHFANRKRLRISVIDRHAIQQEERFLFHHPVFAEQKICQLDFHPTNAESVVARNLIEGWCAEPNVLLHVFVCLDNNAGAVEVGLRLQDALARYENCTLNVRVSHRASLAAILEHPASRGRTISVFGMVEDTCCDQSFRHEENEAIARAAHQDFVQKRPADSNRKPSDDPALNDWEHLQEDLRESNRQQADHIRIKLRAIGCEAVEKIAVRAAVTEFTSGEIEILAEMEHSRWNAERWLSGWRYGVPSDKPNRINENLQSWNTLHDSIKKYDREAVANIPMLLAKANPPLMVVRGKSVS